MASPWVHRISNRLGTGLVIIREGEPDLDELEETARKLIEAQRGPFSADRPPTPKPYSDPTT